MTKPPETAKNELPFSAPAQRNSAPIKNVLEPVLADCENVLEIASGTGQHVVFFAAHFAHVNWQPSEPIAVMREAIDQRIHQSGLANVNPALDIDVCGDWPVISVDAVIVANMLHISPTDTLQGLCAGARSVCSQAGWLHIYGPFKENGVHTAVSNADFDASLRSRNEQWGIRDIETVISTAASHGWHLDAKTPMPANNFSLLFAAT